MRVLPRKWIFFLSDVLASIAFVLFRRFRTRSSTNVRLALGENLDRAGTGEIVRGSLRNFFRSCVEVVGALESSIEAFCSEIPAEASSRTVPSFCKRGWTRSKDSSPPRCPSGRP